MKHLGIMAHSAEGAALCFRTQWEVASERLETPVRELEGGLHGG